MIEKSAVIIEDNLETADLLKVLLEYEGFERLVICHTLNEVEAIVNDLGTFSHFLFDLNLEGGWQRGEGTDGLWILQRIEMANPHGVLVAMTGSYQAGDMIQRHNSNVIVLQKPFSMDDLTQALSPQT
jgi:DNA-binding response OmpR family regulator